VVPNCGLDYSLLAGRGERLASHLRSAGVSPPSVQWCRTSTKTILLIISCRSKVMPEATENPLVNLSDALAERLRVARPLVAGIAAPGHRTRSGTLWRKDVVVASEQRFPDVGDAKVTLSDGSALAARVAGRDSGTNIVALHLDGNVDPAPLPA